MTIKTNTYEASRNSSATQPEIGCRANTATKKPGLKPGQRIRAAKKLKPVMVDLIARDIKARVLDSPSAPYTYAELAEKYGVTSVTLRSKLPVRAAMEEARAAAAATNEEKKLADSDAGDRDPASLIADLRSENKQLKNTIENYKRNHQQIAFWLRSRGNSISQILGEVTNNLLVREGQEEDAVGSAKVLPIFRK